MNMDLANKYFRFDTFKNISYCVNRTPLGFLVNENDFQNVKYPGYPISSTYIYPLSGVTKNIQISDCNTHTLRRLHLM